MTNKLFSQNGPIQRESWSGGEVYWAQTFRPKDYPAYGTHLRSFARSFSGVKLDYTFVKGWCATNVTRTAYKMTVAKLVLYSWAPLAGGPSVFCALHGKIRIIIIIPTQVEKLVTPTVDQTTIILQVIDGSHLFVVFKVYHKMRIPMANIAYCALYTLKIQLAPRAVQITHKIMQGKATQYSNNTPIY